MGGKKKKKEKGKGKGKGKAKGKGKGKNGGAQDPVVLIVSRACAQTLYDILPSLYECIPDLFQAVALALGLSGSWMKEKKDQKGGGKGKGKYKPEPKRKPQPKPTSAGARAASDDVVEDVSSSVFAPRRAARGEGFLVQVFAHLPGENPVAVKSRATEAEPRAVRVGGDLLVQPIKRGTTLTFALSMKDLEIDEPQQNRVWTGRTIGVQFGVTIPKDFKLGSMFGLVVISADTIPIGRSRFAFEVVEPGVYRSEPLSNVGTFMGYQHAFISYAHQDRVEVLKRVQLVSEVSKKFFQDFISLKSGQRWEPAIREAIDRSDVIFLFWSRAASASEYVRKEILYAVERQKGDENAPPAIHPVIIEGPPPAPPPEELKFLHFDDEISYLIFAAEAAAQRKANE